MKSGIMMPSQSGSIIAGSSITAAMNDGITAAFAANRHIIVNSVKLSAESAFHLT